jgi:hypothetical protein
MHELPLIVYRLLETGPERALALDDAYDAHGAPVILDAAANLVEEIFALIDTTEGLTAIAEENIVLAKGALEAAAEAERDYALRKE